MTSTHLRTGRRGEALAEGWLKAKGYRILARNYRCPLGEVDVVAREGRTICFVEVKTRRSERFGSPLQAVTRAKQAQLCKVAWAYLVSHRLADQPVRFDVVGVALGEGGTAAIEHVPGAFDAVP